MLSFGYHEHCCLIFKHTQDDLKTAHSELSDVKQQLIASQEAERTALDKNQALEGHVQHLELQIKVFIYSLSSFQFISYFLLRVIKASFTCIFCSKALRLLMTDESVDKMGID